MSKHLEINNTLLNNPWIKEEVAKEIKEHRTEWKWKYDISKYVGCS